MNAPGTPPRTLLKTMWIGFFLGPFGMHRFYTGHTGPGLFQLLTCGVASVWLFIDIALMIANHKSYASFPDATVAFFGEHWFIRLIQFFLLGVGFVWVSVDMARIVAGRFKDAQGRLLLTSGDTDKK